MVTTSMLSQAERSAATMEMQTLYDAILFGDEETVDRVLEFDEITDIDWCDDSTNSETCLFAAVRNALPGVVDTVISLGADVNHKNTVGETALHIAAQDGKADIIERLITAGASVEPGDTYEGKSPLHLAASNGHVGAVYGILGHGADPSKPERMHCRTPLHEVVRKRKKLMPEKGTRGLTSRNSASSLGEATEAFGSNVSLNSVASSIAGGTDDDVWAQCARALIQHGADLHAKDIEGKTPAHYAKEGLAEAKSAGKKKVWSELVALLNPAGDTDPDTKPDGSTTSGGKEGAYQPTSVAHAKEAMREVESLKEAMERLQREIADLQDKNKHITADSEKSKKSAATLSTALRQMKNDAHRTETHASELEAELARYNVEMQDMSTELNRSRNGADQMSKQLAAANFEVQRLTKVHASTEYKLYGAFGVIAAIVALRLSGKV